MESNTYSSLHGSLLRPADTSNKEGGKQLPAHLVQHKRPNSQSQTRTNRAYELRIGAVRRPPRDSALNCPNATARQLQQTLWNDEVVDPTGDKQQYSNSTFVVPPNSEQSDTNLRLPASPVIQSSKFRNVPRERVHAAKPVATDQIDRCQGDSNTSYNQYPINSTEITAVLHKDTYRKCHWPESYQSKGLDRERESQVLQDTKADKSRTLMDLNEAKINWVNTCESQVQLQPSAEADDKVFSQVKVTEENQSVVATVQPPIATRTPTKESQIRRNGDEPIDRTSEDQSPYTSPSLSTEEISTDTKRTKPLLPNESTRASPYQIPTNRQLPMLSQPTWREQEHRRMQRAICNQSKMHRKPRKKWRSTGFAMSLFGCLKADRGDKTEVTQSSFSRIDPIHDNSNTEDQRTSAISGSSVSTSKTKDISTEKHTSNQPSNSTSKIKPRLKKMKAKYRPAHSQLPTKLSRRFSLKTSYSHRALRCFVKINENAAQLIKQQSYGMEVMCKEFKNVQFAIHEMKNQIDMIFQSLENQKKTVMDLSKRIGSQKVVDGKCIQSRSPTATNRQSKSRTEIIQLESGCPIPTPEIDSKHTGTTIKRDRSLPPQHVRVRNHQKYDSPPTPVNGYCASIQSHEKQTQRPQQSLNSSDDCKAVMAHHPNKPDETSNQDVLHKGPPTEAQFKDNVSIRKPPLLCTDRGDGSHTYFSEFPQNSPKNIHPLKGNTQGQGNTTHMDLVSYSQPTSHLSTPISPTATQDEVVRQAQSNRDLQHYYRIAYIEQESGGPRGSWRCAQRQCTESVQYREQDSNGLRKLSEDAHPVKPESAPRETRLNVAGYVPCSRAEPESLKTSSMFKSSTNNHIENNKPQCEMKDNHHPTEWMPHGQHVTHHTHHREQTDHPKSRRPSSVCRRRIAVEKTEGVTKNSHPKMYAEYGDSSAIPYDDTSRDCVPASATKLHQTEVRQIPESYYLTVPGFAEMEEQIRPHRQCQKQRHKSNTNRHTKSQKFPNSQPVAAACKSKHHQIWTDRNNNSQDWESNTTGLAETNQVCSNFAELPFDELHKKTQKKLCFITSKAIRNHADPKSATGQKKTIEFALPGPKQDKKMGLVERLLEAKREKKRSEDEQRIMNEFERISDQRKNKPSEKSDTNDEKIRADHNQPKISEVHKDSLETTPGPGITQKSQLNTEMTALERCREQRRRRLEEKTETDLKVIVAMTEQAVAERTARTGRINPQGSEQLKEVLNIPTDNLTATGDTMSGQTGANLASKIEIKEAQEKPPEIPDNKPNPQLETEQDPQNRPINQPKRLEEIGVQTYNENEAEMSRKTPQSLVHPMTKNNWSATGFPMTCCAPLIVPSYGYYSWPNLMQLSHIIQPSYTAVLFPRPDLRRFNTLRTTHIRAATNHEHPLETNCIECDSSTSSSLSTTNSTETSSFGTDESVDTGRVQTSSSSLSPVHDYRNIEVREGNEILTKMRYTSPPKPGIRTYIPPWNHNASAVDSCTHKIHHGFHRRTLSSTHHYAGNQASRYPSQRTVRFQLNKPGYN